MKGNLGVVLMFCFLVIATHLMVACGTPEMIKEPVIEQVLLEPAKEEKPEHYAEISVDHLENETISPREEVGADAGEREKPDAITTDVEVHVDSGSEEAPTDAEPDMADGGSNIEPSDLEEMTSEQVREKSSPCTQNPRFGQTCEVGYAACKGTGVWVCSADGKRLLCNGKEDLSKKTAEICDDGKDNDCNGAIDDGCTVTWCHSTDKPCPGTQFCEKFVCYDQCDIAKGKVNNPDCPNPNNSVCHMGMCRKTCDPKKGVGRNPDCMIGTYCNADRLYPSGFCYFSSSRPLLGTKQLGEACTENYQLSSTSCDSSKGLFCHHLTRKCERACDARKGTTQNPDCAVGQVCVEEIVSSYQQGHCQVNGTKKSGENCSVSDPCVYGLACYNGVCTEKVCDPHLGAVTNPACSRTDYCLSVPHLTPSFGVCTPLPGAPTGGSKTFGEECSLSDPNLACDRSKDLFCLNGKCVQGCHPKDGNTSNPKCAPIEICLAQLASPWGGVCASQPSQTQGKECDGVTKRCLSGSLCFSGYCLLGCALFKDPANNPDCGTNAKDYSCFDFDSSSSEGVCRRKCDNAKGVVNNSDCPVGSFCQSGLCATLPPPQVGSKKQDETCSTTDKTSFCQQGLVCFSGVCKVGCDPKSSNPGASCAVDEKCTENTTVSSGGICTKDGELLDFCDSSTPCTSGLQCNNYFNRCYKRCSGSCNLTGYGCYLLLPSNNLECQKTCSPSQPYQDCPVGTLCVTATVYKTSPPNPLSPLSASICVPGGWWNDGPKKLGESCNNTSAQGCQKSNNLFCYQNVCVKACDPRLGNPTNAACSSGEQCVVLAQSPIQGVCVSLRKAGEPCDTVFACQTGLLCVGSKCRKPCSLAKGGASNPICDKDDFCKENPISPLRGLCEPLPAVQQVGQAKVGEACNLNQTSTSCETGLHCLQTGYNEWLGVCVKACHPKDGVSNNPKCGTTEECFDAVTSLGGRCAPKPTQDLDDWCDLSYNCKAGMHCFNHRCHKICDFTKGRNNNSDCPNQTDYKCHKSAPSVCRKNCDPKLGWIVNSACPVGTMCLLDSDAYAPGYCGVQEGIFLRGTVGLGGSCSTIDAEKTKHCDGAKGLFCFYDGNLTCAKACDPRKGTTSNTDCLTTEECLQSYLSFKQGICVTQGGGTLTEGRTCSLANLCTPSLACTDGKCYKHCNPALGSSRNPNCTRTQYCWDYNGTCTGLPSATTGSKILDEPCNRSKSSSRCDSSQNFFCHVLDSSGGGICERACHPKDGTVNNSLCPTGFTCEEDTKDSHLGGRCVLYAPPGKQGAWCGFCSKAGCAVCQSGLSCYKEPQNGIHSQCFQSCDESKGVASNPDCPNQTDYWCHHNDRVCLKKCDPGNGNFDNPSCPVGTYCERWSQAPYTPGFCLPNSPPETGTLNLNDTCSTAPCDGGQNLVCHPSTKKCTTACDPRNGDKDCATGQRCMGTKNSHKGGYCN